MRKLQFRDRLKVKCPMSNSKSGKAKAVHAIWFKVRALFIMYVPYPPLILIITPTVLILVAISIHHTVGIILGTGDIDRGKTEAL